MLLYEGDTAFVHLLAEVRLRPRPPARVLMRNTNVDGVSLNLSTFTCRSSCGGA